ncbi:MAG: Agd3-related carbohydrate-binding protein [Kineosporiaceae bacterium]
MISIFFGRRRARRALIATPLAALAVAAVAAGGLLTPADAANAPSAKANGVVPSVPGFGAVASPKATPGAPLPVKPGTVAVNKKLTIQALRGAARPAVAARGATATSAAVAAAAATPQTTKTGLRALVLAVGASDFGVPTWEQTLKQVGAAYTVVDTAATPLTTDTLVRPDGIGRYNAVLLTSSSLLYQDSTGNYVSGLDGTEWNTLWAYERDYKVRQAALYTSYGTFPEDYCLTGSSEGGVTTTPLNATLTAAAATPFSYLKSGATIPILQSYVYRDRLTAGCSASAVLTAGSDILGVQTTSTDGRERMALTFTSNQYLLQAQLLPYGLFRWASHGLFLGEQKHYLNVDVDDWFNSSDVWGTGTGGLAVGQQWSMRAHDAYNAFTQQSNLRTKYPLASAFTMGMAYNGEDANLSAGSTCSPNGGTAQLTATTKCLKNNFRWINHSLTHPKMNFTDLATNYTEITQNLAVGAQLGLTVDKTVFKSPEYSGLGTYNPNVNDDINPPTDYGLMASNQAMLDAAANAGVKYLHGNMSFASQVPSCFNCGIYHPMKPSLLIVPDYPTNIAYFSQNPTQETDFYNYLYGPTGKFPYYSANQTYAQLISAESDQALQRIAAGAVNTSTFHISNLADYGSGKTLLTDWADAVMSKYSSYYSVPLLSQGWPALAQYAASRNAHFGELAAGVDAVYDSATNQVTITSPAAGSLQISGAQASGFTTYGAESTSLITLSAGTPVTVPGARLG